MELSFTTTETSEKSNKLYAGDDHGSVKRKMDQETADTMSDGKQMNSFFEERTCLALLTVSSLYLRTLNLGLPASVTDGELEMTRQINWYSAGKFFIGKFPPLGGILLSAVAQSLGYYGTEDLLYPGQPFEEFPLVALRKVSALLGSLMVPLCYLTIRNMNHSRTTATLAAGLLMFENGVITQSRYVTPEIYAMFFSVLALYFWTRGYKQYRESFATWPIPTGISLGCAISSKWTGIFAMAVIWMTNIVDTWRRLCEKQNNVKEVTKQFLWNTIILGALPVIVYSAVFKVHFDLLPKAGDHDLLLSPQLKYSLEGNTFERSQSNIAYGSQIIIRHDGSVGGYLHSHKDRFTGGSKQQQVTLYPHADINNIWTVHKPKQLWNASQPIEYVRNGDQIRLEHFASTRKLHSHDVRPQLTSKKEHSEVTGYGDRFIDDKNDYWTLRLLTEDNRPSKNSRLPWKAVNQKFRLQHIRGCNLISHNVWYTSGGNQQEVTCMSSAGPHVSGWVVESAYHETSTNKAYVGYEKASLLEKFVEVHSLMSKYPTAVYNRLQTGISAMDAARSKDHRENTAGKWFLKRTSSKIWSELTGRSVHFILNPFVQRVILISMVVCVSYFCLNALLAQRQITLPYPLSLMYSTGIDSLLTTQYTKSISLFFPAVLIHIFLMKALPSYSINMPDISGAIYCGINLAAIVFEACTCRLPAIAVRSIVFCTIALAFLNFSRLSGLTYGNTMWFRPQCEASGIDIDCLHFPAQHFFESLDVNVNNGNTGRDASAIQTVYVELVGGRTEPVRYEDGEEDEADKKIALLKQRAFSQEAKIATGTLRYHRVLSTPAITAEEAAQWAFEVTSAGLKRLDGNIEGAEQEVEKQTEKEEEKRQPEQEESGKLRQNLNNIVEEDALMEEDD